MVAISEIIQDINFGVFTSDSASIAGLEGVIDSIPEESHGQTVSTTDYPIETGGVMTDHAYLNPTELVFTGAIVSNFAPVLGSLIQIDSRSRAQEAYQRIQAVKDRREPLQVVTLLDVYDSMLITGLHPSANVRTGRALVIDITFRSIIFGETELVQLPPANAGGIVSGKTSTVNGGTKQAPMVREGSALADIYDRVARGGR